MIRRYWLLLTLTIFLALALAACGGKGGEITAARETSAPVAEATAPQPAARGRTHC